MTKYDTEYMGKKIGLAKIEKIKKRLSVIENRNNQVELNKSWETSNTRKLIIMILTYIIIVLFFFVAQLPKPFINSIVPTIGFTLSTLSLPYFKKLWIRYIFKKK